MPARGRKSEAKKAARKPAATKKAAPPKKRASKASAKKAPNRASNRPAIVPDTSVIVDGRITQRLQRNDLSGVRVLIPQAVVSELEFQANGGRETGFNGLDEIVKIQQLKSVADIEVQFVGERPRPEHVELAKAGEIDALIRQVVVEHDAKLLTSDRVQAHVARAQGLDVEYVRPISQPKEVEQDLSRLSLMRYFEDDTMSVHLKYGVPPYAKKGTPGDLRLVKLDERPMELKALTAMRAELIEAARRDADSFVEIERLGATVVQLGPMRIAIAQPPFSDGLEITAVRPVAKLELEAYRLPGEVEARLKDYQRGIFVSGPPGSGKSTFVTAIAEWLKDQDTVVKTMESPRDLQVSDEITQYAPLERDMELTSDVLLLVRPDFVVYDEVRKTRDFEIFADMRLAGVGLIGVTHANRAIDAVQRLIGRVELGMIPQVVDTVIHILKGEIKEILELSFTVKVPHGMVEADLARPVIEVREFLSKKVTHEIYTYGEQVVVMPVKAAGRAAASTRDRFAAEELERRLRRVVSGRYDVEFTGEASATLHAEEWEIPRLIGRGGETVKAIERDLGVKLDIRPRKGQDRGRSAPEPAPAPEGRERRYHEMTPELRKTKKNLVLVIRRDLAGQDVEVTANGDVLFQATVSGKGDIRLSRASDEGQAVLDAVNRGEVVNVRV